MKTMPKIYNGVYEKSKEYALKCHNETNHTYDGAPYSKHLFMVEDEGKEFYHQVGISQLEIPMVLGGLLCHDVIEDCRQTFNDVKDGTGCIEVAELSYALANEKGKNRKERANKKYYKGIRKTEHAVFIKLCDRLANVRFSASKGLDSRMFLNYKKENDNFIYEMIRPDNFFLKIINVLAMVFMTEKHYKRWMISKSKYAPMIYKLNHYFSERFTGTK